LRDKFGNGFAAYTREVPRWLVKLRGLRETLAQSQFRWRRVLVKEYGTPTGWILGICVIALWNLWQTQQLEARANAVDGLVIVMIATALFWLVARALKKSRTVVAD